MRLLLPKYCFNCFKLLLPSSGNSGSISFDSLLEKKSLSNIRQASNTLPINIRATIIDWATISEEIISTSMLTKTEFDKPQEAMDKIIDDLVVVSGNMIQFLGYGLAQIFVLRLGKSWEDFEYKKHDIDVKEQLTDFRLPFFFKL